MKLKTKPAIVILAAIVVCGLVFLFVSRVFWGYDIFDRSGWSRAEDGTVRYLSYDGEALLGWQDVEGKTYYFVPERDGAMATGWLSTSDGRYFLNSNGEKTVGWAVVDGQRRYFDANGLLCTGWLDFGNGRYWLDADGAVHTGWLETEEGRFYLSETGMIQTGWVETPEGLCYLSESGSVTPGWVDTDRGLCYITEEGMLQTGWLEDAGKTYFLTEDGGVHTGWLEDGEDRYYFHEDGTMAIGQVTIDGEARYFTSTGKYFVLVNPWHYVPEDYEVELVPFGNYQIAAVCHDALEAMRKAVLDAGLTFNLTSAYRSHSYQTTLFEDKVDRLMAQGYSRSAAEQETGRSIAIPGTSEHQLGLAVDVKSGGVVYDWLAEHSWEYGFIVRYPNGQTALTGIYYEPWHLRYVGKELAAELVELDLCVEAYMNMLTEQTAKNG